MSETFEALKKIMKMKKQNEKMKLKILSILFGNIQARIQEKNEPPQNFPVFPIFQNVSPICNF